MSSRRDDPGSASGAPERRWRPEPEVGPASGGHLAPDVHATGPLFEDIEPTPGRAARERSQATQRTPQTQRRPRRGSVSGSRTRKPLRRVKRTLKHVDPVSVFKLSLFFYAIGVVVWLFFVALVYSVVDSTGIFDAIEAFSRGLALGWRVEIDLWFVEKWAFLIGVIMWLVGSLVNLVISFLYNVGADTLGGIEMTFVERDEG